MNECGNLRSTFQQSDRSFQQSDRTEEKVIRPMPRRVSTISVANVEVVKQFWQWQSIPQLPVDCETNHEILDIFLSKSSAGDSSGFGCSPPHFSGSPPCRAGNPVVRDVLFSRLGSPAGMATHHPKPPIVAPSYRPSPGVRVEGFECSARGFECTARDTRCHVSALA